jgi:virginiamycin A acetyltransferase
MTASGIPDPTQLHPLADPRVVFLRPLIKAPNIVVGDYTYYDDPDDPEGFERNNVLYSYGPERLVIGRFCALAAGVRFIMAGANHPMVGASTFPFTIFGGEWTDKTLDVLQSLPSRGDTIVGNDVWMGYHALVMPGVTIGDGAIVATGSVVSGDVPPYTIVAGNPAQAVRQRYDDEGIALLLDAAWWDWPIAHITRHVRTIMTGTPEEVARAAPW